MGSAFTNWAKSGVTNGGQKCIISSAYDLYLENRALHSGHFYVRGVTPSVASKANDIKKSVFTKKDPKYSLGFML